MVPVIPKDGGSNEGDTPGRPCHFEGALGLRNLQDEQRFLASLEMTEGSGREDQGSGRNDREKPRKMTVTSPNSKIPRSIL